MSIGEGRGGIPHVRNITFDATGREHSFNGVSKWIRLRVSTFPCKVYFTLADFTADENYISIPVAAAATPYGEWWGPVEASSIWIKGVGGSSVVELVVVKRRN